MSNHGIGNLLRERFAVAVSEVAGRKVAAAETLLRATNDPKFGDYQCNAAMPLGKGLKRKPREIAEAIVAAVQLDDLAEPLEIAGPGFINIRLKPEALGAYLAQVPRPVAGQEDRVGSPGRCACNNCCPVASPARHTDPRSVSDRCPP